MKVQWQRGSHGAARGPGLAEFGVAALHAGAPTMVEVFDVHGDIRTRRKRVRRDELWTRRCGAWRGALAAAATATGWGLEKF